MGGVPSVLLLLWCRGGCSTATVAAALTFFPPSPPCYTLRKKDGSSELELVIDELLESTVPTEGVQIATVRSGGRRGKSSNRGGNGGGGTVDGRSGRSRKKWRKKKRLGSAVSAGGGVIDKSPSSSLPSSSCSSSSSVIPIALYRKAGARYTLVYSHGNATDIGAMHDRCAGIAEAVGVNVLAYDYTGYGIASGSPTEVRTYRDIEAVCEWARQNVLQEGEDGSGRDKGHGLILYGQSVGSGPTCYLASEKGKGQFAGIVLHSPILSGMRVLTESRALSCLDIYPNVDRVSRVQCPVMVMHGMRDEEVPWEHGKGIFEAVPEDLRRRPWWVPDRGHNDICEGRRHLREYFSRLGAFVRSLDNDLDLEASDDGNATLGQPIGAGGGGGGREHPINSVAAVQNSQRTAVPAPPVVSRSSSSASSNSSVDIVDGGVVPAGDGGAGGRPIASGASGGGHQRQPSRHDEVDSTLSISGDGDSGGEDDGDMEAIVGGVGIDEEAVAGVGASGEEILTATTTVALFDSVDNDVDHNDGDEDDDDDDDYDGDDDDGGDDDDDDDDGDEAGGDEAEVDEGVVEGLECAVQAGKEKGEEPLIVSDVEASSAVCCTAVVASSANGGLEMTGVAAL